LNVKKRNGEDFCSIKEQMTEICLKSGILSEFTSFVGVSEIQSSHQTFNRSRLYGDAPGEMCFCCSNACELQCSRNFCCDSSAISP
jgi:hypothetical protein